MTLTHQPEHKRHILHLLYANTLNRGGATKLHGGNIAGMQMSYEVIEELMPVENIDIELRLEGPVKSVTLEPEGEALDFEQAGGGLKLRLPRLLCHQMIALNA